MVKSICGIKEGYSKKTKLSTEIILLDAQARAVGGGTDRQRTCQAEEKAAQDTASLGSTNTSVRPESRMSRRGAVREGEWERPRQEGLVCLLKNPTLIMWATRSYWRNLNMIK